MRSLRSITLVFLLAFLIATFGTAYATYVATHETILRLADARLVAASDAVAGVPPFTRRVDVLQRIDRLSRAPDTRDLGFVLDDADGRRLGGNMAIHSRLPLGYSTLRSGDRVKGLRALVRDLGQGMTLTTMLETEPIDEFGAVRFWIHLIGYGSIVAVVIGGILVFSSTVRRRIAEVRLTADAIVAGDMQRRVPVDRAGGAFAEQAQAFNRMLDRIAELMHEIGTVSNDIAHDLRTPLARLRSQLALIARRAESPAMRAEIEGAIAQSDELLAMFAAILRIVEIEGGDRRAGFVPLDLGAFVREFGEMMQPVVAESARTLVLDPSERATVYGDPQLLSQALMNLLENGMRHTPEGSRIALGTVRVEKAAVVTLSDDGPGIAADQRALALRRFGRLDASRARAGHGLGLSLVEAIVRLHHGGITLEDAAPGLRVVITLPAMEKPGPDPQRGSDPGAG